MIGRRQRLVARRRTRGLSQEALARQLDVDVTTVQRWESGQRTPQLWVRRSLAEALDLTPDQLHELLLTDTASSADVDDPDVLEQLERAVENPRFTDRRLVRHLENVLAAERR